MAAGPNLREGLALRDWPAWPPGRPAARCWPRGGVSRVSQADAGQRQVRARWRDLDLVWGLAADLCSTAVFMRRQIVHFAEARSPVCPDLIGATQVCKRAPQGHHGIRAAWRCEMELSSICRDRTKRQVTYGAPPPRTMPSPHLSVLGVSERTPARRQCHTFSGAFGSHLLGCFRLV